jgi:hypothetical protein
MRQSAPAHPASCPSNHTVQLGAHGRNRLALLAVALVSTLASTAGAQTIDLARSRFVELTHPFNVNTVYWPTTPSGFTYAPISNGRTEGGWFYSAGAFQAPEHGGTHIDAPVHFKEGGHTLDQIPLKRLVGPAYVIDVSSAAAGSPSSSYARAGTGNGSTRRPTSETTRRATHPTCVSPASAKPRCGSSSSSAASVRSASTRRPSIPGARPTSRPTEWPRQPACPASRT